jgi:PTS system nitrogen regulatory IIA component
MSEAGLVELIQRGGVYRDIPGATPRDVLTYLSELSLPAVVDRNRLLAAVLEREALMPTAVGHGIALPHPRNPLITDERQQFVSIAFLQKPVDWSALDGEPVHTLILIVSASAKLHLHTLSQINFLCHQEGFRDMLKDRPSQAEIIKIIQDAEQAWN